MIEGVYKCNKAGCTDTDWDNPLIKMAGKVHTRLCNRHRTEFDAYYINHPAFLEYEPFRLAVVEANARVAREAAVARVSEETKALVMDLKQQEISWQNRWREMSEAWLRLEANHD